MEDNQKFNFNLDDLSRRIESLKNTDPSDIETKEQKVARLVELLHKIEREMTKLETVLHGLWESGRKSNNDILMHQATEKLKTVERLKIKVQKARLNLNLYFVSK